MGRGGLEAGAWVVGVGGIIFGLKAAARDLLGESSAVSVEFSRNPSPCNASASLLLAVQQCDSFFLAPFDYVSSVVPNPGTRGLQAKKTGTGICGIRDALSRDGI